ncbi:MAG TPA: DUF72 domain-containing protein [Xanthobacteraceae bacterium]|jgi:uncharacterized protein YecE (DUF72 family)
MIRVGIGGWDFKPWRGEFYPAGLPHARELEYASRKLTSIEINGTFYRTQRPESFRKWARETPDDFVFSVKAPRYATHRRVLAEAGESIRLFLASGVLEMGAKLGPILWQLHPNKKFEPEDFAGFLRLLPARLDGRVLRHVIEVRHASFVDPALITLTREAAVAIALVDSDKHPLIADLTADFVYARLQRTSEKVKTGYRPSMLEVWAKRARAWADGGVPKDLPAVAGHPPMKQDRDVYIYMIAGAKARAPAAAMALIEQLG